MKNLLFFAFLLVSGITFSQNYPTTGQIYDFNTGDEFQTENIAVTFGPAPPTYVTTTILSKWYSLNSDTVFYGIREDSYTLPSCQTCSPGQVQSFDTLFYTNLNDTVPHSNSTTCLAVHDSVYFSSQYCNQLVWEKTPVNDTGCFEPVTSSTLYIAGCGGPFHDSFYPMGPLSLSKKLIYFKKGNLSCGSQNTTGIYSINDVSIAIYPNPTQKEFSIIAKDLFNRYELFSSDGRFIECGSVQNNNVRLNTNSFGIFLVRLFNQSGNNFSRIIIIN